MGTEVGFAEQKLIPALFACYSHGSRWRFGTRITSAIRFQVSEQK